MALRNLNASSILDRRCTTASKKKIACLPTSPPPTATTISNFNDENLDVLGGPNKLPLPFPASKSSPHPLSEELAPDVEYILSEDLKPLEDVDTKVQTLLDRLNSKDWTVICEALNQLRQMSIYHKAACYPILNQIVQLLIKALKNPRSALCKTAIMASTDLFKAYQDEMLAFIDPLLLQLLLKASQDKRFVCEEAEKALEGTTTWISPAALMHKLQPYVSHRNPRVRARAAQCVCKSVSKLGLEGMKIYGFDHLIQIAAAQLNDQLPKAREAARKLLLDLHSAYRQQNINNDDGPVDNEHPESTEVHNQQDTWEHLCNSQLSSTVAQAVLRLTSAS